MGCVLGKEGTGSPTRSLDSLKTEYGYAKGSSEGRNVVIVKELKKDLRSESDVQKSVGIQGGGEGRKISRGGEKDGGVVGNVSRRISINKISADDFPGGWPKWLVENVPADVLSGLVPKSADSYDKLAKVSKTVKKI